MAKTYRSYLPEQDLLLPPSLREWLPDDHLVYFVSDVVDQLNLSAIESVYEEDDRGNPRNHRGWIPRTLLYGYAGELFPSGKIRNELGKTLPFACWRPGINQ